MAEAGYSGTPLPKKLGLKDGQVVGFYNLPETLKELKSAAAFAGVTDLNAEGIDLAREDYDVVHLFLVARADLEAMAEAVLGAIKRDGMVWVSWPKKASKVKTDITEDVIRAVLLPVGLVDVKVCAVDAVWSGLKMMIRRELR